MTIFKVSVLVGFLLLVLIAESHAACWYNELKSGATHCQDKVDKTWHPVGSSWRNSKCDTCHCMVNAQSCCNGWPTRVSGGCAIRYDHDTCTYELINYDKNVPCASTGK